MSIRLSIWLVKRAGELFLGALLTLGAFGRSDFPPGASGWQELRLNLIAVGFFIVASGYIVSCAGLGLRFSRPKPVAYGALMSLVFTGHALFLFLFAGADLPLALLAGGALIVGLVNAAGAMLLIRFQTGR